VAGRIREQDVNEVRERARIDEVVRETVTLKAAGGGSYKGLCPFHDERSPSFHVTPSKGCSPSRVKKRLGSGVAVDIFCKVFVLGMR